MTIGVIAAFLAAIGKLLWMVRKKLQARVDDGPGAAVKKNVRVVVTALSRDLGLAVLKRWNQFTRWVAGGAAEVFDDSWEKTVDDFEVRRQSPRPGEHGQGTAGASTGGEGGDTRSAA